MSIQPIKIPRSKFNLLLEDEENLQQLEKELRKMRLAKIPDEQLERDVAKLKQQRDAIIAVYGAADIDETL